MCNMTDIQSDEEIGRGIELFYLCKFRSKICRVTIRLKWYQINDFSFERM